MHLKICIWSGTARRCCINSTSVIVHASTPHTVHHETVRFRHLKETKLLLAKMMMDRQSFNRVLFEVGGQFSARIRSYFEVYVPHLMLCHNLLSNYPLTTHCRLDYKEARDRMVHLSWYNKTKHLTFPTYSYLSGFYVPTSCLLPAFFFQSFFFSHIFAAIFFRLRTCIDAYKS